MNKKIKSTLSNKAKRLLKRDGRECFYCGIHLKDEEITIEHVLNKTHGGNGNMNNLVLSHMICNHAAGEMSIADKVRMRDRLRKELKIF